MTYDKFLHLQDDLRYLQAAIKDVKRSWFSEDLPHDIRYSLEQADGYVRSAQTYLEAAHVWDESKGT